ncbi:ATP-binding protein [Candidatus Poriferisodalis sp.]|uniref:ATP-binding protein n=1 Tax=Candidatus Poriferisodalis sp. TaxID=3101277 RepID=UPI003B018FA8
MTNNVDTLRVRLSQLAQASLRINESLDFETVLQGVLDSARALTGARYGMIQLRDERGWIVDIVVSGVTKEQARLFWEMPNIMAFQKYVDTFEGPMRLDDFRSHTRAQGLPEFRPPFPVNPVMPVLSVPIRYLGQHLGIIYLCDKEPGPPAAGDEASAPDGIEPGFSADDEEILIMFAAQATLVISNARQHRQEHRARVDLETLVNTVPVGVVVLDAATQAVQSANREMRRIISALRLLGDSETEQLNSATYRRVDGREIPRGELPAVRSLTLGEVVQAEEITIEGSEGHSVTLLVNATPVHDESGAVATAVMTIQDMTPLVELERLRTDFLGMVSHELRAPLASIKGSVATLLESESRLDPAETSQYHRIINEQADYMRDLIGDLIDVVRIETGTLSVNPVAHVVSKLIDDARTAFATAGGRDAVRVTLAPDLPAVMADRRRIVQVLNNLLANAARNSHETSAIRVSAVSEGVHVAVSVADDGRGISAERLPHLFKKFSRTDGSDPGRDLGLGLAICKGIVEAHGGRIWADSDGVGLGTRFTFSLLAADEQPVSERTRSTRGAGTSTRTRVLAVDDDPRALKQVRDALDRAGYEPFVTGDPQRLLELIDEIGPDVILLDLMLPGADGIELMHDILAMHDIPVIFLSAYDQDTLVTKAFEAGAVDYVVKPFSPTELAARIRAALRKRPVPQLAFALDDLVIDYAARSVTLAGRRVELTPIEYRLFTELSTNAGITLSHDQLRQRVWGTNAPRDTRPIRTVVKNLRQKLGEDSRQPKFVLAVRGVGYRMPVPETSSQ